MAFKSNIVVVHSQRTEFSISFNSSSSSRSQCEYSARSMEISNSGHCTVKVASGHTNQHGGMTHRFAAMAGHHSQLGIDGSLNRPLSAPQIPPSLTWYGSNQQEGTKSLENLIAVAITSAVDGAPRKLAEAIVRKGFNLGTTHGLKAVVHGVVKFVAGEAPDEIVASLVSTLGGATKRLAPKLAGICGVVGGGIAAVVGCLIEIGAYAVKVYRKYKELKRRGGSYKREFGKFVFTETIGLLGSCSGVIVSSVVSAIVGLLIGGLAGAAVGAVTGIGIAIAAFLINKGLKWLGGKTYDQVVPAVEADLQATRSGTRGGRGGGSGGGTGMVYFYSIETVCDANNDVLSEIEQRCSFISPLSLDY